MLINFVALLGGLIVLVIAADMFVNGTASIARNLGVSPLLIGLTIVGLGTSAPEILVSAIASLQGNSGLAVGNALGSNIANIGLILGCTALISPLAFHSDLLKRELPILLLISVMCFLLSFDGVSRADSVLMLLALALFIFWLIHVGQKQHNGADEFEEELTAELPAKMASWKAWLFFVIGLAGLLLSSRLLVWAAVNIAEAFDVSDLVIGLTIVALGTSLPELAASIASVIKKEDDLAVGNVIGSNIYNLLAVYSLPGLIAPGVVAPSVLQRDFPVMLGFTGILFLLGFGLNQSGRINRLEGALLLLAYCAYQFIVYQSATAML
ncbi:calcium/sodium antiporter [Methylomarinum vadi]|uniref:calcium/sodium antiporter n=1 Tax=Methylomarinum vadi TaxID=438855 RepID=UPI0004DF3BF6|nr:calcium/sodium antiporter [Methylomarinum vadi]